MREPIDQFRAAIADAGLHPPQIIEPDGKLHRFPSNGKPSDDAGWYVLHDDGIPAGAFGDWRGGLSGTWQADIGRRLTPHEEAAHRARVEAIRHAREAEDAKRKAEARDKAAAIWQAAQPAPNDHPYLVEKGVKAHGLRMHGGALVVPLYSGAELHSLQFIGPDGEKRFLAGGRVAAPPTALAGGGGAKLAAPPKPMTSWVSPISTWSPCDSFTRCTLAPFTAVPWPEPMSVSETS